MEHFYVGAGMALVTYLLGVVVYLSILKIKE